MGFLDRRFQSGLTVFLDAFRVVLYAMFNAPCAMRDLISEGPLSYGCHLIYRLDFWQFGPKYCAALAPKGLNYFRTLLVIVYST